MKVAMIGLRGLDEGLGGIEEYVRETSVRLVGRGCDVTAFCRERFNDRSSYRGVRLVNVPTVYTHHAETAVYAARAMRIAARAGFDVIHTHGLGSNLFAWIARRAGVPVVTTVHGLDWQRSSWGLLGRSALKLGEYLATRTCDDVILVSQALHTYFRMRYPLGRHHCIANGTTASTRSLDAPLGLSHDDYLLFLGRHVPEKGVDTLIRAFRQLDTTKKLVIAGDANYRDDYRHRLRSLAKGDDRIVFTGRVVGDEKDALLQNAYAFCLPSLIEGLPHALLEACARGVCPVISDIPTMHEVVASPSGTNAFEYPVANPDGLVDALRRALADPDRTHRLGERARVSVTSTYDWDETARRTLAVYERTTEPQRSEPLVSIPVSLPATHL